MTPRVLLALATLVLILEARDAHAQSCGTYATYRHEFYANTAPSICGVSGAT